MSKNYNLKDFPSLTAVVHETVKRAPSGIDTRTVADVAGYGSYQTMMSELSRQFGHKLGADMLLPLMDATGSNAPLEFLARERGCVVIPLPEATIGSSKLVKSLAVAIKEFGEFATEAAIDLEGDGLSREHMDRVHKEGHEAIEAIMGMMKLVRDNYEQQSGDKP